MTSRDSANAPVAQLALERTVTAMTEKHVFQKIILLLAVLVVAQLQRMVAG